MVGWSTRPPLRPWSHARPKGGTRPARSRSPRPASMSGPTSSAAVRPPVRATGPPEGLPALRDDAPARRPGTQGRWRPLSESEQQAALEDLHRDVYASSSRGPHESRLRTVLHILASWGLQPFPPSVQSLGALAASLKAGGYSSAGAYLSTYKVEAERRGATWTSRLQRALRDFTRS